MNSRAFGDEKMTLPGLRMDDPRTEGGASAGAGLYPGQNAGFGRPIYHLAGKHYENTIKKSTLTNTYKYCENIIKHVFVVHLRPVVDVIGALVVRMWMILDVFTVCQIPSIDS